MIKKTISLKKQFLTRLLLAMIIIVLLTSAIQLLFINDQINADVSKQAKLISQSIEQGINETNLASRKIENQIDRTMIAISYHIADLLKGKKIDEITNRELVTIKNRLHLAGLTLITQENGDIIGKRSSDPNEIGFSFKEFGGTAYENLASLFDYDVAKDPFLNLVTNDLQVLPIVQSGSHQDKPVFFKYVYYHPPGTNYLINPYIEANDVYLFTSEVGPDTWISNVVKDNAFVREIGVLDPIVFKDPSLEKEIYPPLKKVVYGSYHLKSDQDKNLLVNMIENPKKVAFIEKIDGKKIYKQFLPLDNGKVIYLALDYDQMIGPLYRHSLILVTSGLGSLFILFLITARFFSGIYENIQRIRTQIQLLEAGDFTATSNVRDRSELGKLSESTNRMVNTLNQVLKNTSIQAEGTQKLAVLLEAESSQTVEKLYSLSMETTSNSRQQLDDIMDFLDLIEEYFKQNGIEKPPKIMQKIEKMRTIAKNRTAVTTDMTLTLSDLVKSLHEQSTELMGISNELLRHIAKFKVN